MAMNNLELSCSMKLENNGSAAHYNPRYSAALHSTASDNEGDYEDDYEVIR